MPFTGQPGPGRPPARPTRLTWLIRAMLGLKLKGCDPDDPEPATSNREAMWRLGVELGLQTHHVERLANRCFWPSDTTAEKFVDGLREKFLRLEAAGPGVAADSVLAWLPDRGAYRHIKDPASLREVLGEPADEHDDWVADILDGPSGRLVYRPRGTRYPRDKRTEPRRHRSDVLALHCDEPPIASGFLEDVAGERLPTTHAAELRPDPARSEVRRELEKLKGLVERVREDLRALESRVRQELPDLKKEADSVTRKVTRLNKESRQLEEKIRSGKSLKEELERLGKSATEILTRLEKQAGRHSNGGAGG